MPLRPATRIGPYEIVGPLGAGGMGEVYRARDNRLGRDVALKILPELFASDPDRLSRFEREAKTLAALNHPHIAQIYGFEQGESLSALVMELVDGEDLSQRLARGPLPFDEVLPIARQIADALEAAHDQGIVHRDLKPANIKIRRDGTVKVLDFGLAKVLSPTEAGALRNGEGSGSVENSPTMASAVPTEAGLILGTAAYMSPEQAKGRAVDQRSDIWAFGCVVYEMLTGRRAFDGDDVSDMLAAILRAEPDWHALPPDVPNHVRLLLRRCLLKDARARIAHASVVRFLLDAAIQSAEPLAMPAGSPPRRWVPWAITVVALGAAAVLAWTAARPSQVPPRVVTRSKMDLRELAGFVAVSRDGARIAYTVAGGTEGFFLASRALDQLEPQPIQGSDGGLFPIFSPDAQWVAFSTGTSRSPDNAIKKISIAGGSAVTIASGTFMDGADWGEDDTLVFSGANGLMRVAATGGTPVAITTINQAKGERLHVRPQFLDRDRLLFTMISAETADFALLDLRSGSYQVLAKGGHNGRYVASGHLTFVRGDLLFALPFDIDRRVAIGPEVPVVEEVSILGPERTADYSVSTNGLLVYSFADADRGTTIAWADRGGTVVIPPGDMTRQWDAGRLARDGRRLANGILDSKGGSDIWVVDLDRGAMTRLTFGGINGRPIWTPDGRRIVYAAYSGTQPGIYSVAADGSDKPQPLLLEAGAAPRTISPDGTVLIYRRSDESQRTRLLMLPMTSSARTEPRPLHDAVVNEDDAEISPDGRWVAYVSRETGSDEVFVHAFPTPGARVRISTQTGVRPRWSMDGRQLYYWTASPGLATLMMVTVDAAGSELRVSAPQRLFDINSVGPTWDVTPSNDRFLVEGARIGSAVGTTLVIVTDWFEELRRRAPVKP